MEDILLNLYMTLFPYEFIYCKSGNLSGVENSRGDHFCIENIGWLGDIRYSEVCYSEVQIK